MEYQFEDDDLKGFRMIYPKAEEGTWICENRMSDPPCMNVCRYLIATPDEHDKTGYPPIHGIDCQVSVLCWGGDDINNVTLEAVCSQCVARGEEYRRTQREKAEADRETNRVRK